MSTGVTQGNEFLSRVPLLPGAATPCCDAGARGAGVAPGRAWAHVGSMLRAIRSRDHADARRLMGAALSLLLVLRLLLGPALMPAPGADMVPICTGTGIVYVALDRLPDGSLPQTDLQHADPCPFYGFAAATAEADATVLAASEAPFPGHPVAALLTLPAQAGLAAYSSRAPPALA